MRQLTMIRIHGLPKNNPVKRSGCFFVNADIYYCKHSDKNVVKQEILAPGHFLISVIFLRPCQYTLYELQNFLY